MLAIDFEQLCVFLKFAGTKGGSYDQTNHQLRL